jgi:RNA polymerase sigma factor (sigma-70 family)
MNSSIPLRLLLTQSDARLVSFARAGHERAFEALVRRYRRPLLGYCRRLLLCEDRAEDALQQAFMQAWLALRAGTEVDEVKAWLYRIVHNAALNALRVSGYDYRQLSESLSGVGAPQEDLERRIAVREALAGLAALPELQREALLRTAVEGRTHQQVARDLGLSESALRGLVYRARSSLRASLGALVPPPLVGWALQSGGRGAPLMERLSELGVGGSASVAGLLAKGGAVAVTAGMLASGIAAVHAHRRQGERHFTAHVGAAHRSTPHPDSPSLELASAEQASVAPSAAPRGAVGFGEPAPVRTSPMRRAHRRPLSIAPAPSPARPRTALAPVATSTPSNGRGGSAVENPTNTAGGRGHAGTGSGGESHTKAGDDGGGHAGTGSDGGGSGGGYANGSDSGIGASAGGGNGGGGAANDGGGNSGNGASAGSGDTGGGGQDGHHVVQTIGSDANSGETHSSGAGNNGGAQNNGHSGAQVGQRQSDGGDSSSSHGSSDSAPTGDGGGGGQVRADTGSDSPGRGSSQGPPSNGASGPSAGQPRSSKGGTRG